MCNETANLFFFSFQTDTIAEFESTKRKRKKSPLHDEYDTQSDAELRKSDRKMRTVKLKFINSSDVDAKEDGELSEDDDDDDEEYSGAESDSDPHHNRCSVTISENRQRIIEINDDSDCSSIYSDGSGSCSHQKYSGYFVCNEF